MIISLIMNIAFKKGLFKIDKKSETANKIAFVMIAIVVISLLLGLITSNFIFFVICLLEIVMYFVTALKLGKIINEEEAKEKWKKQKEEERKKNLIDFYIEVLKQNLIPDDNDVKKQKIRLLREKLNFTDYSIKNEDLFNEGEIYGKSLMKQYTDSQHQQVIKLVNEFNKEESKKLIYKDYCGREKRMKIAQDNIKSAEGLINSWSTYGSDLIKAGTRREKNWGIAGGTAEAIAGPVAGLLAAMEVQEENREIRAHNDALKYEAESTQIKLNYRIAEMQKIKEKYQKILDESSLKYEKPISSNEAFELCDIQIDQTIVEHNVTLYAKISAKLKDNIVIDGINCVVDGTLALDVYDDSNKIITLYFVLPLEGLTTNKITLDAKWAYEELLNDKKYEFKLRPYRLCIIEK